MSLLDSLPVNVITPLPTRTLEGLFSNAEQKWTLVDEKGKIALTFASFLDINYQNPGEVLFYPVERGSFADYNKVSKPLVITTNIAQQGVDSDFESTLKKLEDYKLNAIKLSIVTPAITYKNMTLGTFSYNRTNTQGSGLLSVTATFIQVREVETQVTTGVITKPQNPTSAGKINTGQKQTTDITNQTGAGWKQLDSGSILA